MPDIHYEEYDLLDRVNIVGSLLSTMAPTDDDIYYHLRFMQQALPPKELLEVLLTPTLSTALHAHFRPDSLAAL